MGGGLLKMLELEGEEEEDPEEEDTESKIIGWHPESNQA